MSEVTIPKWVIGLAIVVALPTVACFGYYSVQDLGEGHQVLAVPVSLAYPAALIGSTGLVNAAISPRRSLSKLLVWSVATLLPVMLLMVVWY